MTRLLLALAVLALPLRAEDCASCTPAKICAQHAESDKEASKKFQSGMASADAAVRKAAIDAFAAAAMLASTQDPRMTVKHVDPLLDPLIKRLEVTAFRCDCEGGPASANLYE